MPEVVCILHMMQAYSLTPRRDHVSRAAIARGFRPVFDRVPRCGLHIAVALFVGCLLLSESVSAQNQASAMSNVTLTGVTFVKTQNGVSQVLLRADEAEFDIAAKKVHLQGMTVETKSDAGAKEFWMRCDRGVIELASGDFQARGNVQGQTLDGRTFRTESADYDDEKALIFTDAPVLLTEVSGTLRGDGMQYWVREDRLKLKRARMSQPERSTDSKGGSGQ